MKIYHYLRKRGLALFMALVLCLSLLPAQAMAEALPVGETVSPNEEWTQLGYDKIVELLGDDNAANGFTAGDLLRGKLLDGKTIRSLGIGPNMQSVTILEATDQRIFQVTEEDAAVTEKPTIYTITWDFADGSTPPENTPTAVGTIPSHAVPSRDGYTFIGWSPEIVAVTADAIYTAQWTENQPATYTVTYTDGVDGAAFTAQTATVNAGDGTPAFDGTPTRGGYTFTGWNPAVAETVTGDAVYTAQWTAIPSPSEEDDSSPNTVLPNEQPVDDASSLPNQENPASQPSAVPEEEEPQVTEPHEVLSASGGPELTPVYLWAKFAPVENIPGKRTGKPAITQVAVTDVNGMTTDLVHDTGSSIDILWNKTVTMQVVVQFDQNDIESEKSLQFEFQPGIRAKVETDLQTLEALDPDKMKEAESVDIAKKESPLKSTQDPADWGGYKNISGQAMTLWLKNDASHATGRVSLELTLEVDKTLWDQRNNWTVPDAVQIFAIEGTESAVFTANARATTANGNDVVPTLYCGSSNESVPMVEEQVFTMRGNNLLFANVAGSCSSKGNFCEEFSAKVYFPFIETDGEKMYAEYDHCVIKDSSTSGPTIGDIQEDEDGYKYVVLTWQNVYQANEGIGIAPYFKWPEGSLTGATNGQRVFYKYPDLTGKYKYSEDAWTVSANGYKNKPYTTPFNLSNESSFVLGDNSVDRYNWYAKNQSLVYDLGGFIFQNKGLAVSGPQMLEFAYDANDQVSVVRQNIPVSVSPTEDNPLQIWYRSNKQTDWKAVDMTTVSVISGFGVQFTRELAGITDQDEYLTGIRARVPGYGANYSQTTGYTPERGLATTVFGKMLVADKGELQKWATMTITDMAGYELDDNTGTLTAKEGETPKTGLTSSLTLNRPEKPIVGYTDSSDKRGLGFSGEFTGVTQLKAGVPCTYSAKLKMSGYPYGNSMYTENPQFTVTLPKNVTLNGDATIELIDNAGLNIGRDEPTCTVGPPATLEDGRTQYIITTKNLGVGFRGIDVTKDAHVKLNLSLNIGMGSQLEPLDMSQCLSLTLTDPDTGEPIVDPKKYPRQVSGTGNSTAAITILSAPEALMMIEGTGNGTVLKPNERQSVSRTQTDFTVSFSTWNNAKRAVQNGGDLALFVYYIPVPKQGDSNAYSNAAFGLNLEAVTLDGNSGKINVSVTDGDLESATWTPLPEENTDSLHDVKWIRVTATEAIEPGETSEIKVTYSVDKPEELKKGQVIQFNARGTAVFPAGGGLSTLAMSTNAVFVDVATADYAVEYYYDGEKGTAPEGSSTGGTVVVGNGAKVELPEDAAYDGKQYALVHYEVVEATPNGLRKAGARTNVTIDSMTSNKVLKAYYMSDADPSDPTKPGDGIPDKYQCTVTYKVTNGTWNEDASGFFTKRGTDLVHVYDLYELPEGGNWQTTPENQLIGKSPKLEQLPMSTPKDGYRNGGWSGTTPTAETLVTADVTYAYSYTGYYTTKVSYYKLNDSGEAEAWTGKEVVSKDWDINEGYEYDTLDSRITDNSGTYVLYNVEGSLSETSMPAGTQPGDTIEIKAVYAKASSTDENGNPVPDYLRRTVTFNVVGGTWANEDETTITRVYVLGTKNPNNTWTQDLNKTLGNTIPTGQPTDNTYEPKGENDGWSPAQPTPETKVTEHSAYTLTYEKKTANLTFDLNGGQRLMQGENEVTQPVPSDVGAAVQLSGYTATGHTDKDGVAVVFAGWSKTKNTIIYGKGDEKPDLIKEIKMTEDQTVYAVWSLDSDGNGQPDVNETWYLYTITYHYTDALGNEVSNVEVSDLPQGGSGTMAATISLNIPDVVNATAPGNGPKKYALTKVTGNGIELAESNGTYSYTIKAEDNQIDVYYASSDWSEDGNTPDSGRVRVIFNAGTYGTFADSKLEVVYAVEQTSSTAIESPFITTDDVYELEKWTATSDQGGWSYDGTGKMVTIAPNSLEGGHTYTFTAQYKVNEESEPIKTALYAALTVTVSCEKAETTQHSESTTTKSYTITSSSVTDDGLTVTVEIDPAKYVSAYVPGGLVHTAKSQEKISKAIKLTKGLDGWTAETTSVEITTTCDEVIAPSKEDISEPNGVLKDAKVIVVCETKGELHKSITTALNDSKVTNGYTIEAVEYDANGVPTCTIMVNAQPYVALFDWQHTANPENATATIKLIYNKAEGETNPAWHVADVNQLTINFTATCDLSAKKDITQFSLKIEEENVKIEGTNITVTVPNGNDLTSVAPTIGVSDNAAYTPTGAQNFTRPVTYTVTAEDGSTKSYTVTVTVTMPGTTDPIALGKTITVNLAGGKWENEEGWTKSIPEEEKLGPTYTATISGNNTMAEPTKTGYTFSTWGKPAKDSSGNITYTASYTAGQYTVSFNYQGATSGDETKEATVTYDSPYGNLPSPAKTGYNFAGWFTAETGGSEVKSDTIVRTDAAHTLYAHWTEKAALTINTDAQNGHTYDGQPKSFTVTSTPNLGGFTVAYNVSNNWTTSAPKDAGTYDVKVTRSEDGTYKAFEQTITGGLVISPKSVTVDVTICEKVYDGNRTATVSNYTVKGVVPGDTVTATCTAEFTDKNAGKGKPVTITTVKLNDSNYVWDRNTQATGTITPAKLTVTGLENGVTVTKPYDGATDVKAAYNLAFLGKVDDDAVTLTYTGAAYANADVSESVNVTFSGIAVSGSDKDNYTVDASYTTTGKITARNDHTYTVNYLEKGENGIDLVLATAKTVNNATSQATVEETAIEIEGYVKPDPDKQSITIGMEGNTINFYYTKRTDLSYTVNYLRADTDEVLAEAKKVENQTFKAVVTENAIPIEGYASDAESKNCGIKVDGNVITFVYTPIDYAITYNLDGGTVSGNPASYTIETATFTLVNPTRSGYTFAGWTGTGLTGASGAVTIAKGSIGERTYTATWTVNEFVFPFTPTPTPSPAPVPTPAPGGTTITDDETPLGGAVGLNETEHFAYVNGYEDGTVRPTARITRAEVATIFFRLMTEEYRIANWSTGNSFTDADPDAWYNIAISTAAKAGILKGYADGSVKPGNNITRAEFAAIAARFLGDDVTDDGVGDFTDTANHWAAKEIRLAAKAGWITGSGNKFNPDAYITRAEVMIIINRMLDRVPDAEQMLSGMKTWSDNPAGTWYYADVQEATVDHHHERGEDGASEIWTELTEKKDWDALQEEWAANNGASAPKADPAPASSDGESK